MNKQPNCDVTSHVNIVSMYNEIQQMMGTILDNIKQLTKLQKYT